MEEKFKILIVDDDKEILKTLSLLLEDFGYQIDTAENGYVAIDKVKTQKYNLALVDIMMPGINGIVAAREMKKICPELIIIMMTAYVETQEEFQKLVNEGVLTIFRKPLDIPRLVEMIESLKKKIELPLILIVDDRAEDRTLMRNLLEEKNFRVMTAASGKEAIEIIEKYKDNIDIVLLDLVLINETGVEVLEKIRKIKPEIKVIIVTGYTLEDMIQEAINKGAYAYLYKPIDIEIALSIIKEIVDKKQA
jgi:two-component system response regulator (stage 0 sporulation protein F)